VRLFLKILGILLAVILLIPCGFALWGYLFPVGTSDVTSLRVFAPVDRAQAPVQNCEVLGKAAAIPAAQMGRFRDALIAAEGDPQEMASFRDGTVGMVAPRKPSRHHSTYSAQLASHVYCLHTDGIMNWHLNVWRTAIQIERRFSPDEILTIYANSVYFGNDIYGIENASQAYFKKRALQLSVGEAATLAGLIRRPDYLLKHPDKAIERRNEVLDAMVQNHLISSKEAETAKREALHF
jgi:hypothetical protein